MVRIKTEDFYAEIAKNVENRFDTSNYELGRPLLKGKNERVIELKKDELGGKIVKEFVALRAKTYSSSTDKNNEDKKAKIQKSVS